jgi:hypothetical protein
MFLSCDGVIIPEELLKAAGLKKCEEPKKNRRIVENPLIVKAEMRERLIKVMKPRIKKLKKKKSARRRVRLVQSKKDLKTAS